MMRRNLTTSGLLLAGALVGAVLMALLNGAHLRNAHAQQEQPTPDWKAIAAEIEAIKGKLADQSHAMQDVSYHFANLWFAGEKENWDLANFYSSETRSHLHWAVRIIPKRKDSAGKEIDLVAILQAWENTPWKELDASIKAKDKTRFQAAYRFTLETCYGCHKAADKPFIRPQIPTRPETPIVNFDPAAEWPK
jgi:hypothetical protein